MVTLSYVFWSPFEIFMFLNLFNMQHAAEKCGTFLVVVVVFVENRIAEKSMSSGKRWRKLMKICTHAVDDDSCDKNICACAGWWKNSSESISQSSQLNNVYPIDRNRCECVQVRRQELKLWLFFYATSIHLLNFWLIMSTRIQLLKIGKRVLELNRTELKLFEN